MVSRAILLPRCRAAFRMHLGDCASPVATGGVLHPWPGMPEGIGAVHLRLYAEAWASVMSGIRVEFREFSLPTLEEQE